MKELLLPSHTHSDPTIRIEYSKPSPSLLFLRHTLGNHYPISGTKRAIRDPLVAKRLDFRCYFPWWWLRWCVWHLGTLCNQRYAWVTRPEQPKGEKDKVKHSWSCLVFRLLAISRVKTTPISNWSLWKYHSQAGLAVKSTELWELVDQWLASKAVTSCELTKL